MEHTVDYVIIVAFLIGVAIFGSLSGGKQKSTKDYFLGASSVPWWAVMLAIVAAETSTLTFISIPGLAYVANLNFLQVTFGYLIGRIVIALFFLPSYYKGELNTAYSFLENRFGHKTRSFASVVFLFTRTAADGVRLFATAIPLKLLLDINYPLAIVIIAVITLAYTATGGVKGVIYVDVVLMLMYVGGAIVAGYYLINVLLPNGFDSVISAAAAANKFEVFNLGLDKGFSGFFSDPYTLFGGIIGGAFLSMASHGVDQLIIQRLLTTKSLKSSQKAIVGSGVVVIFQFALFLIVGVALFAFYGEMNINSDEVFPKFIIEELPSGLSGLIIAGLFAAAMSTLAGSISALSSSTMLDLYHPNATKQNDKKDLLVSRLVTVFWAIMLVGAAILFMESPQAVVELALSIASFTYGGLLGTFLLGLFVKKAQQEDALAGFTAGIFLMITVIFLDLVAWTWFTLVGVIATVAIGSFLTRLNPKNNISTN